MRHGFVQRLGRYLNAVLDAVQIATRDLACPERDAAI